MVPNPHLNNPILYWLKQNLLLYKTKLYVVSTNAASQHVHGCLGCAYTGAAHVPQSVHDVCAHVATVTFTH